MDMISLDPSARARHLTRWVMPRSFPPMWRLVGTASVTVTVGAELINSPGPVGGIDPLTVGRMGRHRARLRDLITIVIDRFTNHGAQGECSCEDGGW
jgi:hypothetical protein